MNTVPQKQCTRCYEIKPSDQFPKNHTFCKACKAIYMAEWRDRKRVEHAIRVESKECSKCKQWKSASQFSPAKTAKDGLRSDCKACQAEAQLARYYTDHETSKEKQRIWHNEHYDKEARRERQKLEYPEKREHIRAYNKQYNQERSHVRKAYRERTRERNRPLKRVLNRRRRANQRNAPGTFTFTQWQAMCEWFGNVCLCCGKAEITIDHVVPIIKGGSNDISNLQILCMSCNASKKDKTIDYRDPILLQTFLESIL
jgi:5-methylcytosine-specific restriction endonuclease McrA